jgi:arylformamidase
MLARQHHEYEEHSYGPGVDDTLDIFRADRKHAPTLVFIHGGAWRNFSKRDYSFVAPALLAAGVNCIVVNFSKLPDKTLPQVVEQLHLAIDWIYRQSNALGIDAGKLYLCGYSSGAHLSAILLTTDWRERGLAVQPIKGATLISGSYDLRPAVLSARGAYIHVSRDEEWALSPIHFTGRIACSVIVAYAEGDTDEFRRQSEVLAAGLRDNGRAAAVMKLPGLNHFSIIAGLSQPQSSLFKAVVEHIRSTTGVVAASGQ